MFKKTLISLAVASSLGLTGCFDSAGSGSENADPNPQITDTTVDKSIVRPIFDPNPLSPTLAVPAHFDLLLLLGATQSANHDFTALPTGDEPVRSALNELSGFSTSSAFNVAFDGELDPETVIQGQTVFLIALDVDPAVESAPLALPAVNPADIAGIAADENQPNYRIEVISQDGSANNAIRVVPLEPLEEKRKYLVLVSNGVKGANGKNIEQSVQGRNLAEGSLGNAALENVQSLLQGLNKLGGQILGESGQDVALAYSFTTNGDADVLRAMASPLPYLEALGQKIAFTAQLKAVRDNFPDLNFSELTEQLGELGEKAELLGTGELDPASLSEAELNAIVALGQVGDEFQAEIPGAIEAQVGTTLHVPQPRPFVKLDDSPATELTTIQSLAPDPDEPDAEVNPVYAAATRVTVTEGAITLPYYQRLPGEEGSGIVDGFWTGNTDLEKSLNDILAGEGEEAFQFLRDIDTSLNVNGYFPFPQQQATTTVPMTVFHPNVGANQPPSCDDGEGGFVPAKGVTIFQHGITVDRSAATLPALLLAAQTCQAVVAIDQPLHGLAGSGEGLVPGLTPINEEQVIATASATLEGLKAMNVSARPAEEQEYIGLQIQLLGQMLESDYIGERHFGYTDGGGLTPEEAELADIESGSLFINPLNMLNSRDNLRQGVVDLLNVAATVQLMPILNGQPAFMDLPVNFVGHSLGGISGTVFSSLTNDPAVQFILDEDGNPAPSPAAEFLPELTSVSLHNTSGQTTRLIENSPAFSAELLTGLASEGVVQGSSDFESFFYVFQSLVDSGDPVNFAKELGRFQPNLLITEVIGDATVPNEANIGPLDPALSAPLTGTEALMALIDLGAGGTVLADGSEGLAIVDSNSPGAAAPVASFFDGTNPCSDANHGTFVGPTAPNSNCPGGVAVTTDAFAAMVTQTAALISGASSIPGTAVPAVGDTLGSSLTIESALDQDEAQ